MSPVEVNFITVVGAVRGRGSRMEESWERGGVPDGTKRQHDLLQQLERARAREREREREGF